MADTVDDIPSTLSTVTTTAPTASTSSAPASAYAYPPAPLYPALTPHLHKSPIAIKSTPETGRGIYATESIPANTVIDISPVLLLSDGEYYGGGKAGDCLGVEGSALRGYVFTWRGKEGGMALALGLGSLFNHSPQPNVSFALNLDAYTITYTSFKSIAEGEELCIFYGHQANFGPSPPSELSSTATAEEVARREEFEEKEDGWGGLGGVIEKVTLAVKEVTLSKEERKRRWERELVPWAELSWAKVTDEIDPEDMPLTLMSCWAVDVPAMRTKDVFAFSRRFSTTDALANLKRVRSPLPTADSPAASKDTIVSILLFPTTLMPLDRLLAELDAVPLKDYLAGATHAPYEISVPAGTARTDAQVKEWGAVWPVQICHIREGAGGKVRVKGWERAKVDWVQRRAESVWRKAREAGERGECPSACEVSEAWDSDFHSSETQPTLLASEVDTRNSTGNALCHAASNAIDAIAALDLPAGPAFPSSTLSTATAIPSTTTGYGARRPPCPSIPADPYLLTGLAVFTSHEPCLLCSMSLLHSRIKELYYVKRSPGAGGCGTEFRVHEDGGLNHKFEVWRWEAGEGEGGVEGGLGVGCELEVDP